MFIFIAQHVTTLNFLSLAHLHTRTECMLTYFIYYEYFLLASHSPHQSVRNHKILLVFILFLIGVFNHPVLDRRHHNCLAR